MLFLFFKTVINFALAKCFLNILFPDVRGSFENPFKRKCNVLKSDDGFKTGCDRMFSAMNLFKQ